MSFLPLASFKNSDRFNLSADLPRLVHNRPDTRAGGPIEFFRSESANRAAHLSYRTSVPGINKKFSFAPIFAMSMSFDENRRQTGFSPKRRVARTNAMSASHLKPAAVDGIFNRMIELGPENVVDYLRSTGRLSPQENADARLLAWGVSNVVLRVCVAGGDEFVIKQSRKQLRTEVPWFSRLDRIWREMDVMQTLQPLLPAGVVPRVLFDDRENYLFAMQAIDANHTVWKAQLLAGIVEPSIAATLGEYLGTIHAGTANNSELQQRWGDTEVFVQLRVDPFYRHIANVHSELRPDLDSLIDEMFQTPACVVHADFSPKNILVTNRGLALVDFETAHYGDPAFDLGFFLSHLMLKTVLHAGRCCEFLELMRRFWQHYTARLGDLTASGPFSATELERRTIGHLAACMLSRIDGTSTIDYLPAETARNLVREFCRHLLRDKPRNLDTVFQELDSELKASGLSNVNDVNSEEPEP